MRIFFVALLLQRGSFAGSISVKILCSKVLALIEWKDRCWLVLGLDSLAIPDDSLLLESGSTSSPKASESSFCLKKLRIIIHKFLDIIRFRIYYYKIVAYIKKSGHALKNAPDKLTIYSQPFCEIFSILQHMFTIPLPRHFLKKSKFVFLYFFK